MNLEKNCFKDFGRNLFQRFWSKIISNFLEAKIFKDFGRKAFQRFWRKIASKNLRIYIYIFFSDKSRNLYKIVLVLLSASVERFFFPCMLDFFYDISWSLYYILKFKFSCHLGFQFSHYKFVGHYIPFSEYLTDPVSPGLFHQILKTSYLPNC